MSHQPLIQRRIGGALGVEQPAPGSRHPGRASRAPRDRRRPAGSRRDRRHPNSPPTMPCPASSRMHATAASSGIAMNAAAAWFSSCQARTLGSPQASPAISVSRLPGTVAGSTQFGARQQAGGTIRFHHDQRRRRLKARPHLHRDRGGHAADTTLDEHMRRRLAVPLVGGLVSHQPVALHDLARHFGVAVPRCVRHDEPAMLPLPAAPPRAPHRHRCRARGAPRRRNGRSHPRGPG